MKRQWLEEEQFLGAFKIGENGGWMPRWLSWYLLLNLQGKEKRQQRRLLALNFVCVWGMSSCFIHGVYYLVHDMTLWPASVFSSILAIVVFVIPFVNRLGSSVLALYFVGPLSGLFVVFTYLLGIKSGSHLFILILPPVIVVILGSRQVGLIVLSTVICSIQFLFCLIFLSDPLLAAASRPPFHAIAQSLAAFVPISMITAAILLSLRRAETAEDALNAEHARSEALLYNLLPEKIAARLKADPDRVIADGLEQVAILFADIVGFTPRTAKLPPEEVVAFLNRIFRAFDILLEKHGLEKIKTIGDAYMAASGMPVPCEQPVHQVAEMALDMQRMVAEMSADFPEGLEVRIGMHAGPAVAGVIGSQKLFYDVWGETVNTASRMESHGEPGCIQVTTRVKEELEADYEFKYRGIVDVKGMGELETWWLMGKVEPG